MRQRTPPPSWAAGVTSTSATRGARPITAASRVSHVEPPKSPRVSHNPPPPWQRGWRRLPRPFSSHAVEHEAAPWLSALLPNRRRSIRGARDQFAPPDIDSRCRRLIFDSLDAAIPAENDCPIHIRGCQEQGRKQQRPAQGKKHFGYEKERN